MSTAEIQKSEEFQKKLIQEFIAKVKNKSSFSNEEFFEVFEFACHIVKSCCDVQDIDVGFKVKSNRLENIEQSDFDKISEKRLSTLDIAGCIYREGLKKDVVFYLDPAFFCKRFFNKNNLQDKYDGIAELLITIYHEVDYMIKRKEIEQGKMSPETLLIAREIFVAEVYGEQVYKNNYDAFFFERHAEEYAHDKASELVTDSEVLESIKKSADRKMLKERSAESTKVIKIMPHSMAHDKDGGLDEMCRRMVRESPNALYHYPFFSKQYNEDKTFKNIHGLMEDMTLELNKIVHDHSALGMEQEITPELKRDFKDCEEFYYELMLPQLIKASEQDYKTFAEKYGVVKINKMLVDMEKYFNDKANNKLKFARKEAGDEQDSPNTIKDELKKSINAIVRFRNGVMPTPIADKLLREGGFVRRTREVLPEDVLKRRELFANSLIGVYDAIESEDEYKQRAENEKLDIDEVVNALYYNRFEGYLKNVEIDSLEKSGEIELGRSEIVRTAQILKMVKVLSAHTNQDYFKEFLTIPDVNSLMVMFEKDKNGYLKECLNKAHIRIKKVVYPNTEAEDGKYKDYILGLEQSEDGMDIKNKMEMLNEEMTSREKNKINRRYFGVDR